MALGKAKPVFSSRIQSTSWREWENDMERISALSGAAGFVMGLCFPP